MKDLNPAGLSEKELSALRAKFPAGGFKIDPDSEVKADEHGHVSCSTTPQHPDGMKLKDRNKRYVFVHRVVIENSLGRLINPQKEEIHHKDNNPKNNRLSNLELHTHDSHAQEGEFWKKSPRTKPGQRRMVARVVNVFLHCER